MNCAHDLALIFGGDAVREFGEPFMQGGPKREACRDRHRRGDRAEAGNVFASHCAGDAAVFP